MKIIFITIVDLEVSMRGGLSGVILLGLSFLLGPAACGRANIDQGRTAPADRLRVVASTTIVGDVVRVVGGEAINLTVLLPTGVDPHGFDPTPQDVARVTQAEVVFVNGAGLEAFLGPLLQAAGGDTRIESVSAGIQFRQFTGETNPDGGPGSSGLPESEPAGDPHVWMEPNNVMVWAGNIARVLAELDPARAGFFDSNARRYQEELNELDHWIQEQVAEIPPESRKLVTDHATFGYFASRYGFEQVGAIIPGYSTVAEPSAGEVAALIDAIQSLNVKAIFVGSTVNPSLAERVAQDTGTRLVSVYTESLTDVNGPADTYLKYMRYNVIALVSALK